MASGPEADRLRLRAARVFVAVQDWAAALEVLDAISDTDPDVRAWVALLTARSAWKAGRPDLLRSAIDTGLELTEGVDSEVGVRLRVERPRVPLLIDYDIPTAIASATEGLALARRSGTAVGRAVYYLGTALSLVDDPTAVDLLTEAIERARAEGDSETELAAAYNLINYHEFAGDPVAGRALAEQMIERAEELRSGSWVGAFTVGLAGLQFHAGEVVAALDTCARAVDRPMDVRSRDAAVERELLSLLELGRIDEVERRALAWADQAAHDHMGQSLLVLIRAEAALWGGHPRRALALAQQYLAGIQGDTNLAFGLPTLAWAQLDSGIEPQPVAPLFLRRMLSGVPDEVSGVRLLAQDQPQPAAELFASAARAWAPYHKRGDLRCRWAQGEALRRTGSERIAIEVLEQVESDAQSLGHRLILGRIRQSLRRLGVQRSAERVGVTGGLSGREREVLELAGHGLTNAQIGARLGITRRTVVSLVETASTKLGAGSRSQAVALAAADPDAAPHPDPTVSVG
jgi:DNA-binding CsgD family transcriptional regulator